MPFIRSEDSVFKLIVYRKKEAMLVQNMGIMRKEVGIPIKKDKG